MKRRDFLKTIGLGVAGLAIGLHAETKSSQKVIRGIGSSIMRIDEHDYIDLGSTGGDKMKEQLIIRRHYKKLFFKHKIEGNAELRDFYFKLQYDTKANINTGKFGPMTNEHRRFRDSLIKKNVWRYLKF